MVSLIRAIFGKALKTNEALDFAVLTGCLRVSKESIFTGLNNFKILSITDTRFDEQFGFTDREVKDLLSYYNVEDKFKETKEWYDGYRFGNVDIYCPWDVINYVDLIYLLNYYTPLYRNGLKNQFFQIRSSCNSSGKRLKKEIRKE